MTNPTIDTLELSIEFGVEHPKTMAIIERMVTIGKIARPDVITAEAHGLPEVEVYAFPMDRKQDMIDVAAKLSPSYKTALGKLWARKEGTKPEPEPEPKPMPKPEPKPGVLPRPTFEEISEWLRLDPKADRPYWRKRISNFISTGDWAGWGYDSPIPPSLKFQYREYLVSNIVWLLKTGEWPSGHLTHLDGDTSNVRFTNLELTTSMSRLRAFNGPFGDPLTEDCIYKADGKYRVIFHLGGSPYSLGLFQTVKDAVNLRDNWLANRGKL